MAITTACFDSAGPALAGLRGASPVRLRGAVARRGAGLDWPLARGRASKSTQTGSNPSRAASQCGLCGVISRCGRTADIPAVRLVCPSLWPAILRLLVPGRWFSGVSLCSPFSNFRFDPSETGTDVQQIALDLGPTLAELAC